MKSHQAANKRRRRREAIGLQMFRTRVSRKRKDLCILRMRLTTLADDYRVGQKTGPLSAYIFKKTEPIYVFFGTINIVHRVSKKRQ